MTLFDEAVAALARGWVLIPLDGKLPVLGGWVTAKQPSEKSVQRWIESGHNIGIVCGSSGLFVLDIDPGGECPKIPRTPCQKTPRGGMHYFFKRIPGLKNTASAIGPHIDTRADGGMVLLAGSHDGKYEWVIHPDDCPLADFPIELLPKDEEPSKKRRIPKSDRSGWARAALESESSSVSAAAEGTRNDTLNRAAFNLGQIVAGGGLDGTEVHDVLMRAAKSAGLDERESEATIRSGMRGGSGSPRLPPENEPIHRPKAHSISEDGEIQTDTVLIPGVHVDANGEILEIGVDQFAASVLRMLPKEILYRRERVVGEIMDGSFVQISSVKVRRLIDRNMKLAKWKQGKTGPELHFVPSDDDYGKLVLCAASDSARELKIISAHPIVGPDFKPMKKGWNEEHGAYVMMEVPPAHDPEILDDLVTDFPFDSPASRENFYGLMLTQALRYAIRGNVPMHMIMSPQERCGKTKLVDEIIGELFLGGPMPALQLSGNEEERDKRIVARILSGATLTHLDNIGEFLNSPALCSLITARLYSGRLLGKSEMVTLPNYMTLISTANNPRATGEIVKRCVPIVLVPGDDKPEERTNFKHPDLIGWVRAHRMEILGAIFGMIESWRAAGCPKPIGKPMGGFESWYRTVGGIMAHCGYADWRTNASSWQTIADQHSDDLRAFVSSWGSVYGTNPVGASTLWTLAKDKGLFEHIQLKPTDKAQLVSFGQMLSKIVGRCFVGYRVARSGTASDRMYALLSQ